MSNVVNVARDFTRFPSGRYKRNGSTSGEEFRQRFLESNIREGKLTTVELDGTIGYGSSFLEEAFGGLVRSLPQNKDIHRLLIFKSENSALKEEIAEYINDALGLVNKGHR
jgi:STAS-like domain of unknown function (DUF4325)